LPKPGVFLDRDDTIIKDVGYLDNPEGIEILPGAAKAIKSLNDYGMPVIVVTNQSGIARGMFDENTLKRIHDRLINLLKMQGARIDAVYYCPHHPQGKIRVYGITCRCRKPEPGMLVKAARDLCLDLPQSYMVGDKAIDIETIHRVGGKGILLDPSKTVDAGLRPDFIAANITVAVQWILEDIDT